MDDKERSFLTGEGFIGRYRRKAGESLLEFCSAKSKTRSGRDHSAVLGAAQRTRKG
jgi:hypothetical protein